MYLNLFKKKIAPSCRSNRISEYLFIERKSKTPSSEDELLAVSNEVLNAKI